MIASFKKYISLLNPKERFNRDVSWYIISLGVLGGIGLANNVILKSQRGNYGLGIFSIVYAIYIITSQIAAGGIQLSVLKNISYNQGDKEICREIYSSAVFLILLTTSLVAGLTYCTRDIISSFTQNPTEVSLGIKLIIPGLFAYSLNKVLLYVLNGTRMMRSLAVFQGLRIVFLCISIIIILALGFPTVLIPAAISIGETSLLIILFGYVSIKYAPPVFSLRILKWFPEHFSFGVRSVMTGVLFNINLRVDQIMLSHFFEADVVGIYTFASFFAEGLNEVANAVKRNVDPILGRFFSNGNVKAMNIIIGRVKKNFTPLIAILCFLAALGFPALSLFFGFTPSFKSSWYVLLILLIGVFISARYRPFYWVLIQGGKPEKYTIVMVTVVLSNILLNYILIDLVGLLGAAIATTFTFILHAYLVKIISWKFLSVKI